MRQMIEPQANTMPDVILYPRDTVVRALEVMHRYGVQLLPVVDERGGEVLGHVSLELLRRLGNRLPLARMAEILTARAAMGTEGIAGGRQVQEAPAEAWVH